MKKALLAASLAMFSCTSVQADTLLGLYIGGQVWDAQAEGTFGEGLSNQVSFNFDDEQQGSFFVAIEHPIPLIPNIKVASTTLDTIGSATVSGSFDFGGIMYDANSELATTFDTSYVDYTLYYEVFDNDLLTFDFGLTARDLDTYIDMLDEDNSKNSDLSASGFVPMVYVNTIVGLPFTGFNFFAEANFLSFDGHTIYDYQVGVSYALLDNIAVDFDINLGYRDVKLELDDLDGLYSDLTFNGVFVGAVVHF
ncbi:MAG: TIGR04219 family outer membrane beta-barrel protein [Colwellia sp.]